jgi:hypothetical protein
MTHDDLIAQYGSVDRLAAAFLELPGDDWDRLMDWLMPRIAETWLDDGLAGEVLFAQERSIECLRKKES